MVTIIVPFPLAEVHFRDIQDDLRGWLAKAVAHDASRYAPVDTGYLHTHIKPNADNTKVIASGAGRPPNKDAPAYVEYGTRPHDIPNAFGWGITAHHPGTHPQPYLRPAAYTRRVIPANTVRARSSWAPR
jgi:hypothetical protein